MPVSKDTPSSSINPLSQDKKDELLRVVDVYHTAIIRLNHEAGRLRAQLEQRQNDRAPFKVLRGLSSGNNQASNQDAKSLSIAKRLASIDVEQREIIYHLRVHQEAVAPALNLPPEILATIFTLCLSSDPFHLWDKEHMPITVSHVCSRWRQVALSTSHLWRSLSLPVHPERMKKHLLLLRCWAERSATLPVSLKLTWHTSNSLSQWFIREVAPHVHTSSGRWQHLSLTLPGSAVVHLLNVPMPQLQSLWLSFEQPAGLVHFPLLTAPEAPLLRDFTLASLYETPLNFRIPWAQITHLTSKYCLPGGLALELFQRCPNLVHCRIRITDQLVMNGEFPKAATLRRLESLTIFVGPYERFGQVLHYMAFPSLREFILFQSSQCFEDIHWPMGAIDGLVKRSQCPLSRLLIRGFRLSEGDVINCIKSIPSLTDFQFFCGGKDVVTEEERQELRIRMKL